MRTSTFQPTRSREAVEPQERPAEREVGRAHGVASAQPDVAAQLESATRLGHRWANIDLESWDRLDQDSRRQLPDSVRLPMEAALDADFSTVHIHEGKQAEALDAVAFTQGNHIHFAPGHFDPGDPEGQELLGHELAHVLQQRAGRLESFPARGMSINADPTLEAEAENRGAQAAASLQKVADREPIQGSQATGAPAKLPASGSSAGDATHGVGRGGPVQLSRNKRRPKGKTMSLGEFHRREEQREQQQQQQIQQHFRQQVTPQLGAAAAAFQQRQQDRSDPDRPYLPYDSALWRKHGRAKPTTDKGQMIQNRRNKTHAKFHEDTNLPGTFSEFHIADETIGQGVAGRNVYYDVQREPVDPGHTTSRALAKGPRKQSTSPVHAQAAGKFGRFVGASLQQEAHEQASGNAQQGIWRTPEVTPEMAGGMNRQEALDYLRRRRQDERAANTAARRQRSKQAYKEKKRQQGYHDGDEQAVAGVDPRRVHEPIERDTNIEDNETWAAKFRWPDDDNDI